MSDLNVGTRRKNKVVEVIKDVGPEQRASRCLWSRSEIIGNGLHIPFSRPAGFMCRME